MYLNIFRPIKMPLIEGTKYYVIFIDDFSKKLWIFILKVKNEYLLSFKEFNALVEK